MASVGWSLATIELDGAPQACVELAGKFYRLKPVLERGGLSSVDAIADIFNHWDKAQAILDATEWLEADVVSGGRRLAPLLYPGKILCAGANYYDHLAEMGMPDAKKAEQRLFFFMKPPRNAIVGEGETVCMPIGTRAFDWEIELAAVIGKRARNVSIETALSHVAGYTVSIDFSARDHNRAPETFYKLDWVAGKAHDACCPIGPRIVPARSFPNPQDIGLKLSVNGEVKQNGRTSDMIFSIAEQISIASKIMTLDPGDLLLTGTPAGVGAPRQTFLKIGDRVDAEIDGVGLLSVTIAPER